jgi:hypothetical protein
MAILFINGCVGTPATGNDPLCKGVGVGNNTPPIVANGVGVFTPGIVAWGVRLPNDRGVGVAFLVFFLPPQAVISRALITTSANKIRDLFLTIEIPFYKDKFLLFWIVRLLWLFLQGDWMTLSSQKDDLLSKLDKPPRLYDNKMLEMVIRLVVRLRARCYTFSYL